MPEKADDRGLDTGSDDGALEESQGAIYDTMLSAGPWLGQQLSDFLLARSQARARRLFETWARLTSFPSALSEIADWIDWIIAGVPLPREIVDLATYIKTTTFSAAESVLSGDEDGATTQARLLMEAEFLLRDFAEEPARIHEWATLTPFERSRKYSFGETRKRAEKRQGIPQDYALPDRGEYQAHSRTAHPSPAGEIADYPDLATGLFYEFGDLLDHAHRALIALINLLPALDDPDDGEDAGGEPEFPGSPSTASMDHAFAEMRAYSEQNLPDLFRERQPRPLRWREEGLQEALEQWRARSDQHGGTS